jgi:glutamine synthetase
MLPIEYIWLGGNGELRSKTRVLMHHNKELSVDDIPEWNYDGSSTGQAEGGNSEIIIKPRRMFKSPFQSTSVLVLCDTYLPNGEHHPSNTRYNADDTFSQNLKAKPWFGIEQEYFLIDPKTKKPLGFSTDMSPQGQYYCSVGAENTFGRTLVNEHLRCCLNAGIIISGLNAEVAPGQWEFQIGPCEGIESGDHLWIARYLLERLAENYKLTVNYHPKPMEGDWNGSGCHTNYSTLEMREGTIDKTGLDHIHEAVEKLSKNHDEHMAVYGSGNELRMTGEHETSDFHSFSSGVGDRGASVRIPNDIVKHEKGYFEDRRPSSNMDPYLVTSKIFETTVLN